MQQDKTQGPDNLKLWYRWLVHLLDRSVSKEEGNDDWRFRNRRNWHYQNSYTAFEDVDWRKSEKINYKDFHQPFPRRQKRSLENNKLKFDWSPRWPSQQLQWPHSFNQLCLDSVQYLSYTSWNERSNRTTSPYGVQVTWKVYHQCQWCRNMCKQLPPLVRNRVLHCIDDQVGAHSRFRLHVSLFDRSGDTR